MFTQIGISLLFVSMIYLNMINVALTTSTDMEHQEQKRFPPAFFGRYGFDPTYLLTNRPYYDGNLDRDMALFHKRQIKKKWAALFQRSQSPYTIAFPALIRTRRSTEQE